MQRCPPRIDLHALLDGTLESAAQERTEAHLRDCAGCRDRMRGLRRVDLFLARRAGVAEGSVEGRALLAAALRGPIREGRPGRPQVQGSLRRRILAGAGILAAAGLLVVVMQSLEQERARGPDLTPGLEPEQRLAAVLGEWPEDWFVPGSAPEPSRWRDRLLAAGFGSLQEPWGRRRLAAELVVLMQAGATELRYRSARTAGWLGALEAASALAALAADPELEPLRAAEVLAALGGLGGPLAARAVRQAAEARAFGPLDLARALVATGEGREAAQVAELLDAGGADRALWWESVAHLPGRESARLLATRLLEEPAEPAGIDAILARADVLQELRTAARVAAAPTAIRAWGLLVRAGEPGALGAIERRAGVSADAPQVVATLASLAAAGHPGALAAIISRLPVLEQHLPWPQTPEDEQVAQVLLTLDPGVLAPLSARLIHGAEEFPTRERLRSLLALGLGGGREALPALAAALDRPRDRQAALVALARSGLPEALPLVAGWLGVPDLSVRRTAMEALVRLGGAAAIEPLAGILGAPRERRALVRVLDRAGGPWALPLLERALSYGDVRREARLLIARWAREPVARNRPHREPRSRDTLS